jgi:hypothetical protein
MSTVTEARRRLQTHGKKGNWRFKGLMLAALPNSGVSMREVARAWPSSGHPSQYRFLSRNSRYDPVEESERRLVAQPGDESFRLLREFAGQSGMTKTLGAKKPTNIGGHSLGSGLDDMIKRTLFATSTPEEVDILFREQLLDVVMEGAQRRQIARDAADVMIVDTRKGDIPVAQDQTFATRVQEGAAIRDDDEEYTTIPYETVKFGQGARVTDEMTRHAQIDLIERQVQYVGESIENAINRVWLNELIDNAGNNFDTEGSDQGIAAINGAYGEVDQDDFVPDTFVTHPEFRTSLFNEENIAFANRAGTDDVIRERVFDPLLGVEHRGASDSVYNSSENEFGYSADGEIGAVVYDRAAIHIIMENEVEVKDYEDPIRDLQGVNARVNVDCVYSQSRAASTIEF